MFTLLKLIRLAITAICALVLFVSFRGGDIAGLIVFVPITGLVLAIIWLGPLLFRHHPSKLPTKFAGGFEPTASHDNIAIDANMELLWLRDPLRGERYFHRSDILAARTNYDWRNGTFRQRIELQVNDTAYPQYSVLFERHSDTWIKTSKLNGQERDEWFERIRAWTGLMTVR